MPNTSESCRPDVAAPSSPGRASRSTISDSAEYPRPIPSAANARATMPNRMGTSGIRRVAVPAEDAHGDHEEREPDEPGRAEPLDPRACSHEPAVHESGGGRQGDARDLGREAAPALERERDVGVGREERERQRAAQEDRRRQATREAQRPAGTSERNATTRPRRRPPTSGTSR